MWLSFFFSLKRSGKRKYIENNQREYRNMCEHQFQRNRRKKPDFFGANLLTIFPAIYRDLYPGQYYYADFHLFVTNKLYSKELYEGVKHGILTISYLCRQIQLDKELAERLDAIYKKPVWRPKKRKRRCKWYGW